MLTADSLARFAAVLADRSRAGICLALLDRRAWTAGELARHVGVARSTASEHLNVLVSAGLLAEERQGRHRYLRLADPQTAQLVEDLAAAVGVPGRPASLRAARAAGQLAAARTCYDHLAGVLGVSLFDALVDAELINTRNGLALTCSGRVWFADLAGAGALRPCGTRPLVRTPVWTGPNGAATSAALSAQPGTTNSWNELDHPNRTAPRCHRHPHRRPSTRRPPQPGPASAPRAALSSGTDHAPVANR